VNLGKLFYRSGKLQEVDLTGFDTTRVTDFHKMFDKCLALKRVRLDRGFVLFKGEGVADEDMFKDCPAELKVELEGQALTPKSWKQAATVQVGVARGDGDSASARWVQRALDALGYLEGSVDGSFGPKTEDALTRFQLDAGLEATGVGDLQTLLALAERTGN